LIEPNKTNLYHQTQAETKPFFEDMHAVIIFLAH
jgi:hypothetical protein